MKLCDNNERCILFGVSLIGTHFFIFRKENIMNENNNRNSNSPNPNSQPPKLLLPILIAIFIAVLALFATCDNNDEDCGMCNGSGYYQKKTCPACNGSGNSDYDPYEHYNNTFN